MKNYIKIALIMAVVASIVAIIVYYGKTIDDGGGIPIAATSFEKKVQYRVDKEIKSKEYNKARKAFFSILSEINTEASITLGDGTKNLSNSEIDNSKRILFYEYAPIFIKYALSYFTRTSWDDSSIKGFREEAMSLQNMNIAESKTDTFADLNIIISTVNDYFAAWKVVNSASLCSSVSAISSLKSSANKYMHKPLTNNASLSAALNSVESKARTSVIRNIAGYCNSIARGCLKYPDYIAWTAAYDGACKRIEEYRSAINYPDELKRARTALDNADNEALEYFSN